MLLDNRPAGNVVLWSVDTDYLTLSLVHDDYARTCEHRVYVSTGRFGTENELFDVAAMRVGDRLSFAVVSALCGNDYVDKPACVSRAVLWQAYQSFRWPLARRLDDERILVDFYALLELLARAYALRLGHAAPTSWRDYDALAAAMTAHYTGGGDTPPRGDELVALYDDIQWSVQYVGAVPSATPSLDMAVAAAPSGVDAAAAAAAAVK